MYSFSSIKCSVLLGVVSAFSAIDSYSLRSLEREGGERERGDRGRGEKREIALVSVYFFTHY